MGKINVDRLRVNRAVRLSLLINLDRQPDGQVLPSAPTFLVVAVSPVSTWEVYRTKDIADARAEAIVAARGAGIPFEDLP
ncbi:hypothetical protein V5F59_05755 [Xanthobacter autotrophicus DSM 431]|uniref:hypothetical protein n=1 Tax=Xanthobacter nonsaccharivorans TaxID=3119912 RepID=UPI00372CE5C7